LLGLIAAIALPFLTVHLGSTLLARALRVYSPSMLEELCEARQHPGRAVAVAMQEDRTAQAADLAATASAIVLAALLAWADYESESGRWALSIVGLGLLVFAVARIAVHVYAHAHAEDVLDRVWPATRLLRTTMAPVGALIRMAESRAYQRSGRMRTGPRPTSVELELPVATSGSNPATVGNVLDLPDATLELLERVVAFSARAVDEAMTPRSAIRMIAASATLDDATRAFTESGFSRMPLYGENRDNIVGILHAKDVLSHRIDHPDDDDPDLLRRLAQPPLFVPETKKAAELLDEMRPRRVQIAIVLDEYGSVAGLITLEDLLEELVGEIEDEYDEPEPLEPVIDLGDGRYEFDASLPVDELNDRLGLHLPTDDDYSTVGGLAFSTIGHLPDPGTSFTIDGARFTVVSVENHSIRRLQLEWQPAGIPSET
jgi:CBS domain containing-hemolysin-like protein